MKILVIILATFFLFSCGNTVAEDPVIRELDFNVIEKDSTYTIVYTINKDSLNLINAKVDLINTIRGAGKNRNNLVSKYQTVFNSNFETDVSQLFKQNLKGNWKLVSDSFEKDLTIDDNTSLKFVEPNIIAILYENNVLSLAINKDKIVGILDDEKVYLEKIE